jgi:glycosyltransferase involved in cell wall biosynthesis
MTQSARRPKAWHLGRQGEVAGGMTQVVNAYLSWPFQHFDVGVITSRDGTKGLRAVWLAIAALCEILFKPDVSNQVLIAHLSQRGSFVREGLLMRLAKLRGWPTVAHLHGSSFAGFASASPRLVKFVLSAADEVIVLSAETESVVKALIASDRVHLVPNAVPNGSPRPKESLVVFGGGVGVRKGVDVLTKAWRQIGAGRGWTLVMAGPYIDPEVVDESLPDSRWLGAVPHTELMKLLERSKVAVLPSRDEAMPMFILEAMGRDCCVVSTAVGGIPAVLADGCGVVVEPGDASELAIALDGLLSDEKNRQNIAARGRAKFDECFSSSTVYPRVEALWASAQRRTSTPT